MPSDLPQPDAPQDDLATVAARIARAIAHAEATPADARPRMVAFRVGGERLGLPLPSVREVMLPPTVLSRVPRAPEGVLGIMNLRGRVIALVDLLQALPTNVAASLPGLEPRPAGAALGSGRVLVFEHGRREVGLLVESVEGLVAPDDDPSGEPLPVLDPPSLIAALEALVS